jgi:hypothetical protein
MMTLFFISTSSNWGSIVGSTPARLTGVLRFFASPNGQTKGKLFSIAGSTLTRHRAKILK